MRFYNRQHRHYCGIDLHVKAMYLCILNSTGQVLLHKNVKTTPQAFLEAIHDERRRWITSVICRLGEGAALPANAGRSGESAGVPSSAHAARPVADDRRLVTLRTYA
jgi:predicted NBD/HSP70 family sugar kinase